ncbi:type IV pilus assembly protein PilO [Bacillus sp. SORGH_AS 510]|uniref:pilus assembly protein PilO n=1 Tax=Bacillus sp. SORGH_AS_0510 TaxID=3041771 RepID=UPI0027858991|nr:pilus assembly protein PilO [Bacillus sp. SORGH_AS_0510]MDQ1144868.1 type IV pilus assembly protein PilO [Bacillus sp. SORGH_AS_0510]
MRLYLSKKHKLIVAVGVLLLVLLIVYAQFFSLNPLKSDLGTKQQELKSEQKLLDIVSQKKAASAKSTTVDTKELQKKLPVGPLQEQFILDLEKAEAVSNSQITSMGFSKDADVAVTTDPASQNTNAGQTTTTNTTQTTAADPNAATQPGQPATTPVPTGLKKMTVQLSVESPKYEDLEKFIETLESLQRLVVVEAITYSGGQEITSLSQEDAPISYSLTVSAFYMPTLADLAAEQPTIDAPAPAGKDNPLSQFPSTATTQP